jgi:UDP-N-acetylglucosamine enolpyruvyl transferase
MSLDQDELNYEEQDDLGDFDNRMTQASESDKVGIQHDISQHQSLVILGGKTGSRGASVCTVNVTGCFVLVVAWLIAVRSFGCTSVDSCFIF